MFKECLHNNIVPFIITDQYKGYYYRGLKERVSGYLLYRTKAAPSLAESPVYSYISIQYNDLFYKAMHQGIKPITVPSFNNTR